MQFVFYMYCISRKCRRKTTISKSLATLDFGMVSVVASSRKTVLLIFISKDNQGELL